MTTDPMFIMTEMGRCRSPSNLLIRESAFDTVMTRTVLQLHQNKKIKKEMKRQRMVCINNNPVEKYGSRMNPNSSSGIYMTTVEEAQCHIVAKNRRK